MCFVPGLCWLMTRWIALYHSLTLSTPFSCVSTMMVSFSDNNNGVLIVLQHSYSVVESKGSSTAVHGSTKVNCTRAPLPKFVLT